MPGLFQESEGRRSGQGTGIGLRPGNLAEPEEAGATQFRCAVRAAVSAGLVDLLNHGPHCAVCLTRVVLEAVKRSADAASTPLTSTSQVDAENVWLQTFSASLQAGVPHSAAGAHAACAYTVPYTRVQTARQLLPGQPLPQGVVAFSLAVPCKGGQ